MPLLHHDDADLYYEVYGRGFPVLLLAPGFMMSGIDRWRPNPARPDLVPSQSDPTADLVDEFTLIAMDQRNAGRSRASLASTDGWDSYMRDQLAILDHLAIERCHVIGACIGVSFALKLCEAAPDRFGALVLQNPIGLSATNRPVLRRLFDLWADSLVGREDVTMSSREALWQAMFGGDFLFSVSADVVVALDQPMLVMPGTDEEHPADISATLVERAKRAETFFPWRGRSLYEAATERSRLFLRAHTPAGTTA